MAPTLNLKILRRGRDFVSREAVVLWKYRFFVIGAACIGLGVVYVSFGLNKVLFFDEQEYLTLAENLLKSGTYGYSLGVPSAARPPGYVLFIIPIVALGLGKSGIVLAQILLWGASIYLAGKISFHLRGPIAAGIAVLLGALYPLCGFVSLTVYPQILTAFLVLLFIWALLQQPVSLKNAAFIGIVVGSAILVTPILLPVFFAVLIISNFFFLAAIRSTLIAALVCCCVIAPWVGRNLMVLGAPSISTIVGFNLIYANSENASPELGTAANIDKYSDAVRGLNEVETDRAFRNFALDWMYKNPASAMKLYVGKFIQFFGWKEVIRTPVAHVETFQRVVAIAYYPLLILSVVGMMYFGLSRDYRGEIIMFLFYLIAAAFHAIFLQRLRYRVEVDFLMVIIAADFLGTMIRRSLSNKTSFA